MALTDEQEAAVSLFKNAKSLKISAFAGTGKTTTLTAIGNSTRRSGVYLAFNKSIATEASSKFPRSVDCRTTHSLALRSLPRQYKDNKAKIFDGLQGNRVAHLLDLEELAIGDVLLKPRSLGYITAKTIQRYCQSGSQEILRSHVPLSGKLQALNPSDREQFENYLAKLAAHLWDRMLDPQDTAPLGHDGYLKLWSLNRPEMQYDFILLDEAQDTNEAVLSVLTKQDAQLTLVGDRHQQIYEWRGAVNAMAKVETAAESALTQSFRFGPEIADIANRILSDLKEARTLTGNPGIISKITTQGRTRAVLCRTNVGVIEVTLAAMKRNERPHVVGGVAELVRMLEDVTRLKRQVPAETPDLFGFSDWDEVVEFADSEDGESLRTFVTIVNQNGERALIRALEDVCDNEGVADLIVSTGHKAKGREWASVTLHTDFEPKKRSKEDPNKLLLNEEETRLLYVASTRPQQLLVVPSRLATAWGLQGTNPGISSEKGAVVEPSKRPAPPVRTHTPRPELPAIANAVKSPAASPAAGVGVGRKEAAPAPSTIPVQGQAVQGTSRTYTPPPAAPTEQSGFFAAVFKAMFGRK